MNILLLNQFFPPDPAPTGRLLADVARNLAEGGHRVSVICSGASYTETAQSKEDFEVPGVMVRRISTAPFEHRAAARLMSYATFYAGALKHALWSHPYDAVLTLTTPPLLSLVGTLAKKIRASKHFIWEMDVYPDIAIALSILRSGSLLEKVIGTLADFSRRQSDGIVALGPCMYSRLRARGFSAEKVTVAENWADGSLTRPHPFPPNLPLSILYSGNLGLAHDISTVIEAMTRLSDPARFRFVFAGGGARRNELESRCRVAKLTNVSFLPYQDERRLSEHLGNCHIGLVTQNSATCGAVVPSKAYGIMAAGRPFIFIGPSEATPALNISRFHCGWHMRPGESSSLVDLLEFLADHPEAIRLAGHCAHVAFENNYELHQGVTRIAQLICRTARKPAPIAKATSATA
jgi:colanic acid biosynthesis glycosyl transferase WcaI